MSASGRRLATVVAMADEGTRWVRNETLTGAVIASPPECLGDPGLFHGEFVAMQPLGGDWGPSIAVIPEAAVQGAPATFKEISD